MPAPRTGCPVEWARYNASILGMTPAQLDAERLAPEEPRDEETVLATTVAVLTPSGELVAAVSRALERLEHHQEYVVHDALQGAMRRLEKRGWLR